MKNRSSLLESLISGGLIGAALGAFLSRDKEEGAFIGALLGAAFSATLKANEEAQKTEVPVYVEENGRLYEMHRNGEKRFVKKIKKPDVILPGTFKLKP